MVCGNSVVLVFVELEEILQLCLVGDFCVDCSGEGERRVGGEDITGGKPYVGVGEGKGEASPFSVGSHSGADARYYFCHLFLKQVYRFGG